MGSQKRKEKRGSRNAKRKVRSSDEDREQPEPIQNTANDAGGVDNTDDDMNDANDDANDANDDASDANDDANDAIDDASDANDANAKSHGSGSNYRRPTVRGEDEDSDSVQDLDESIERDKFLAEGARQDGMHIQNGVRSLPLEVAECLQLYSFIFRRAWSCFHDGKLNADLQQALIDDIKGINKQMRDFKIENKYIEAWKSSFSDYKRPRNVGSDKENYVNSFQLSTGLIDTIVLIKKELESFLQTPESKIKMRRKLAHSITLAMFAQRSIIYNMGLTYKSMIDPDLAEPVCLAIQEGLATVDKRLKSQIIAWLGQDDRDPTTVQRILIEQVPHTLDTFFSNLQEKKPIVEQMKKLEEMQNALNQSNKSMSFAETDHQLGIEQLRKMVQVLDKTTKKTFHNKLESLKWAYIIYLDAQGWKCLIDETPALRLQSRKDEKKLLEARPQRKLIDFSVPVLSELDEENHPLEENENESEDDNKQDQDGDEDESDNDSDNADGSHETIDVSEDDDSDSDKNAPMSGKNYYNDGQPEDVEMGGQDDDDDQSPKKNHRTRAKSPMQSHNRDKTRFSPELNTRPPRGFSKCIVRGPLNPEDPATPFGYVVGGRMIGLLGSRFIVNVGTFESPVHKILPGTEFGRKAGPELVKKMPLPMPELAPDIEDRHAADVLDLVGFVEDKPNSPQPGRRPVTYYAIVWQKKGSKPLWISRSDLISVCGKAWLDRKTQDVFNDDGKVIRESRSNVLEAAWRWNLEYLDIMKAKGLHPDTKKPLRESDRKIMPWLFQGPSMSTRSTKDEPKVKVEPDEDDTAHIGLKAKRFRF